ncbi:hypothetical protein F442_19541 [Phytophthora nicotianae P10297]|uniref:Uncharacterized protein n=1 Tax=Phytophthora nicotianae P10297 TaxID=1317064 RepID=W2Y935_PHYNI|nr:hypothetical protein F442_19541 [Phytophthora nicotianae P10297]
MVVAFNLKAAEACDAFYVVCGGQGDLNEQAYAFLKIEA